MKQAYLICAHGNFTLLKCLIHQLDDTDNDIYIHFDKKIGSVDYETFENITKYSNVFCLRKRNNVVWGHISLTLTSIDLLEFALSHFEYDYFHLISGVDFPIKSNAYIKRFLCEHNGLEFIGFLQNADLSYKLGLYHLIPHNLQQKYNFFKLLDVVLLSIQRIFHICNHKNLNKFVKGCNWWSITNVLAKDIVSHKLYFKNEYRFTSCSDEIFLQTYVSQHKDKYKIYDTFDEYHGCIRKIDWERGKPYVWQLKDIDELQSSGALFARKFSEENIEVIYKLMNILK